MGMDVPVVGLDKSLQNIPEGSLVMIEGGNSKITTNFIQIIGDRAFSNGWQVVYITSLQHEDVEKQISSFNLNPEGFIIMEKVPLSKWASLLNKKILLIIDSFTYMMTGHPVQEYKDVVEALRKNAVESNSIVIFKAEKGMLDEKLDAIVGHQVDGIIRFMYRETSEGVVRFIRIPKWAGDEALDLNTYYTFESNQIRVDTRSRVV